VSRRKDPHDGIYAALFVLGLFAGFAMLLLGISLL